MLVLFYSEISDNTSSNSNNFFVFLANFQELHCQYFKKITC
jgi:hypothetical protein